LTYFLQVGKTQDLPSKIWQTLGDVPHVETPAYPTLYGRGMHVKHQRFGEFILRFWLKRGSSW
jgi:hypothetical protein